MGILLLAGYSYWPRTLTYRVPKAYHTFRGNPHL